VLDQGAIRAAARAEQTMIALRAVTGLSRDRSGIRIDQSAIKPEDRKNVRDLAAFKEWWNLPSAPLNRNLREVWRKDIVPIGAALKQDTDGVWLTRNSRRVFVAVAAQSPGKESWTFSVKPKSYEILALLCWDENFQIHDFVIPQKLYVAPWTAAKKASGKNNIDFSIERINGRYMLQLPNATAIDITETAEDYGIIGN
jgi:tryptophanyl-tRNA synthetase